MELPEPLVSAEWLAANAPAEDLVVAHVGWSAAGGTKGAEADFGRGHLPGAVFLDLDRDLASRPFSDGPGRHPLPAPVAFARTMGSAGIGDETAVVAYDSAGGSLAARLWWMLDAAGHAAALLDGGLPAWTGPLELGEARRRKQEPFTSRPWPAERVADTATVERVLREGLVLDARALERYRGETEPIDPVAGHIPGAVSAPWAGNLDDGGRFLDAVALRQRYEALGAHATTEVVLQCGSGVTACHGLLARRLAGLPDAKLYEGSWSDWVSDPERPVATG